MAVWPGLEAVHQGCAAGPDPSAGDGQPPHQAGVGAGWVLGAACWAVGAQPEREWQGGAGLCGSYLSGREVGAAPHRVAPSIISTRMHSASGLCGPLVLYCVLYRVLYRTSSSFLQDKLDFLHLPIIDGSVTSDVALSRLADDCCSRLLRGERMYIHW